MQISDFSGGINIYKDPSLIAPNQSVGLVNANVESGVLKSQKSLVQNTQYGTVDGNSVYYFNGKLFSGNNLDYVEYDNNLYWSGESKLKKYSNGTEESLEGQTLGIQRPEEKPEAVVNFVTTSYNSKYKVVSRNVDPEIVSESSGYWDPPPTGANTTGGVYSSADETPFYGVQEYKILTYLNNDVVAVWHSSVDVGDHTRNGTGTAYGQLYYPSSIKVYVDAVPKTLVTTDGSLPDDVYTYAVYRLYENQWHIIKDTKKFETVTSNGDDYEVFDNFTDEEWDISSYGTYIEPVDTVYQYCYTYYDSVNDTESAQSDFTDEINIKNTNGNYDFSSQIDISKIMVSSDTNVDKIRIYRLGHTLVSMHLLTTIDNVKNADSSRGQPDDIFYSDILSDNPDSTLNEVLTSSSNYAVPDNCKNLTLAYGMFFVFDNNKLLFSSIGDANYWPPENSITLPENGKGILAISQGLLLFTLYETYLLTGTSLTNFSLIKISSTQGCVDSKSCHVVKNTPLWLSNDGICTYQGGQVLTYSRSRLGKLDFDFLNAGVYDEQYFLIENSGKVLVLDLRFEPIFYTLNHNIALENIFTIQNQFLASKADQIYQHSTTDYEELAYVSPIFTHNDYTALKYYNKIFIRYDGTFNVTMYIDSQEVFNLDISGNTTAELHCPSDKQVGYSCQFEIEGKGTIYSIKVIPNTNELQQSNN